MNHPLIRLLFIGWWLASSGFGRADESIREVPVDGFRLTFTVEGEGTPCLVINDAPAMQKGLSPGLRKRFKFIFMNPRMNVPYDPSFDLGRITLDTLVDDIEAVRRAAGVDRVVVFGHSINGLIAYEYARQYPGRVLGVIMNGTPPFRNERFSKLYADYWESTASPERKEALRKSRERTREAIAQLDPGEAMRQTYIAAGAVYWNDPSYDCSWLLEGVRWNKEVWDRLFEGIVEGYDISTRDPIRQPVLLTLGRNDFAVPVISWDGLDRILPNIKIVLFEESGHWPFVDERELFDARLLDWLDGIPGSR